MMSDKKKKNTSSIKRLVVKIGTSVLVDENKKISTDKIKEIAGKLGISDDQVSGGLAVLLPHIIDKLTPDGKVPDSGMLEQGLSSLLQKFAKG